MAINYAGGDFYPHRKPGIYSYTKHFVDEFGGRTAYLAYDNTIYPGLGGFNQSVVNKALWNIRALMEGARGAELAFINDTGININDPNNAGDILKVINKILNSQQTFERGIKYMKSLNGANKSEKDKMYRDVTRYFSYYLSESVKKQLKGYGPKRIATKTRDEIKDMINQIIGNALIESYEHVKDFIGTNGEIQGKFGKNHDVTQKKENMTEVKAITDMIETIKDLQGNGVFGNFGYLFGMDLDAMTKKNNQPFLELKNKNYRYAKVDANYGGSALELVISTVSAQIAQGILNVNNPDLKITGMHTGQLNEMKADALLFVGSAEVQPEDYLELVDRDQFKDSVRMQNVDALEKYYNKLKDSVQHVIAVSAKNYSITSDFGGIAAQEKMNLKNVGALLEQFGVDHVKELVTYLANCGPAMVHGAIADEMRTELQSYIGYFLFDNLQFEIKGDQPKPNVVNLLNVSGVYIPLSVYLEGLYNSLQEIAMTPSDFVNVTISLGGPTEQNVWTEDTWKQFRTDHETDTYISYRILKGVAEFITGLV